MVPPRPNPESCLAGRFGIGVKAYFVFLRYLVYLNLLHCALIGAFIIGPTIIYGNNSGELVSGDELPTKSKPTPELFVPFPQHF